MTFYLPRYGGSMLTWADCGLRHVSTNGSGYLLRIHVHVSQVGVKGEWSPYSIA